MAAIRSDAIRKMRSVESIKRFHYARNRKEFAFEKVCEVLFLERSPAVEVFNTVVRSKNELHVGG